VARELVVAAAQTGPVHASAERAIVDAAHAMLEQAAAQGVALLAFSELFLAPFFPNRLTERFDAFFMPPDDPVLEGLRARARALGIALVLPFAERGRAGCFNAASVLDRDGRAAGHYRKTHIPAYFPTDAPGGTGSYEKMYFTPGEALDVIDVAGTRVGVQICNDRLYPEGSRVLALRGAEILVMPICYSTYADPAHRASIWEVPLRARAYENGAYVMACNRVGVEGERHHLGRSMIVDPRGAIVAEAGTQAPELLVARIDLDDVAAARKRLPWWRDRRPDLYGPLVHVA
jgi:N-carbamoylputrescine amidase